MNSYIITISVIAIITVISDIILPSGKMKKSANIVFSLMLTLAILSPLSEVVNIDVSNIEKSQQVYNDYIVDYIYKIRNDETIKIVDDILKNHNYLGYNISCNFDEYYNVKNIVINFDDKGIFDNTENINILEEIKNEISQKLNILSGGVTIE